MHRSAPANEWFGRHVKLSRLRQPNLAEWVPAMGPSELCWVTSPCSLSLCDACRVSGGEWTELPRTVYLSAILTLLKPAMRVSLCCALDTFRHCAGCCLLVLVRLCLSLMWLRAFSLGVTAVSLSCGPHAAPYLLSKTDT